ncbi:MAG: class F sortase [Chloroflexota bacterium]
MFANAGETLSTGSSAVGVNSGDILISLESMPPAPDGSLPPPSEPESIAWYTDSAALGAGGTMLLAGHVDWVGRRAAFRELDTLREGDDI